VARGVGAGASTSKGVGVGGGLRVRRQEAAGGDAAGDGVVEGCGAVGCALVE